MGTVNLSKQTVNLSKGEKINLSKSVEGLSNIMVGLGWDPADDKITEQVTRVVKPGFFGKLLGKKEHTVTSTVTRRTGRSETIDCDAWLLLLENGKWNDNQSQDSGHYPIIYYGNRYFYDKKGNTVIYHHGDNLTGEGDGDDEQISINLKELPSKYDSIVIAVTIYRGKEKGQSFGGLQNTFVRVVDERDNFEICRFNQAEMAENKDAITFIVGKLYKDKGDWQFSAYGKGTMDESIMKAANHYRYD